MPLYKRKRTSSKKTKYAKKKGIKPMKAKAVDHRFGANATIVRYLSKRRMPVAPRYQCKMTCSNTGTIAAGATASFSIIKLNNPDLSFGFVTFAAPAKAVAALQPSMLTQIFNNNFYSQGRVFSSKIKFRLLPTNPQDVMMVSVSPISPNTTVASATYYTVEQDPYTKVGIFNNSIEDKWVTNSISQHVNSGVPEATVRLDNSGAYSFTTGSSPAQLCYWYLTYQTAAAGQATLKPMGWEIIVEHYCEFYGLENLNLMQT